MFGAGKRTFPTHLTRFALGSEMCYNSHTSLQTSGIPDGNNNNSSLIFITALWKMFAGFLLSEFNSHQYFKED